MKKFLVCPKFRKNREKEKFRQFLDFFFYKNKKAEKLQNLSW